MAEWKRDILVVGVTEKDMTKDDSRIFDILVVGKEISFNRI